MTNKFELKKNFIYNSTNNDLVDLLANTVSPEDIKIDCRIDDNNNDIIFTFTDTSVSNNNGDPYKLQLNNYIIVTQPDQQTQSTTQPAPATQAPAPAQAPAQAVTPIIFTIDHNLFKQYLIHGENKISLKKGDVVLFNNTFDVDRRPPEIEQPVDTSSLPWGKELRKNEIKEGTVTVKVNNANGGEVTFQIKKQDGTPVLNDNNTPISNKIPISNEEFTEEFQVSEGFLKKLEDHTYYSVIVEVKNKVECKVIKKIDFYVDLNPRLPANYEAMIQKIRKEQKGLNQKVLPSQINQLIYKNLIELDFGNEYSLKPISEKTWGVGSIYLRDMVPSNRYDFHIGRKIRSHMYTSVLVNDFIRILGDPFKNDKWTFTDEKLPDGNTITAEQINKNIIKKYMEWDGIKGKSIPNVVDDVSEWKQQEGTMFKIIKDIRGGDIMREEYNNVVKQIRKKSIKTFLSFFSVGDSIKRRFLKGGKTRKKSKRKSVRKTRSKK